MQINRENYESYFLDYLEGRLDPSMEKELRGFLGNNPDLCAELKEFDSIRIPATEMDFPDKEYLKDPQLGKLDNPETRFAVFAIAFHEEDLTAHEKRLLEAYLEKNPGKRKELESYGKLFVRQNHNLRFPNKKELKKPVSATVYLKSRMVILSAAASLALLVASYFLFLYSPARMEYTARAQVDTIGIKTPAPVLPGKVLPDSSGTVKQSVVSTIPKRKYLPSESGGNPGIRIRLTVNTEMLPVSSGLRLNPIPRMEVSVESRVVSYPQLADLHRHQGNTGWEEPERLAAKAVYQFKKSVLGEPEEEIRTDRFSLWELADAGVRGINEIAGWEMKLEKEYDSDGRIAYLAFDSKAIQFSHTPKK